MSSGDLAADRDIDFADVRLTYDGFRRLAINPHLSVHGRIGFPDSYRDGHERDIFNDIRARLPALQRDNQTVLDIGPGCAGLPRMMVELCERRAHRLYFIDLPEMLAQLPDAIHVRKIDGPFPDCMPAVDSELAGRVDALLCYSVLHYLFAETNPFHIVDVVARLLAPGGVALFGDIPNASKRQRFFTSAAGIACHRAFTGESEPPPPAPRSGSIDDGVLLAMVQRAHSAGCDAYVVPQPDNLPMANRRDDLIIRKP